MCLATALRIRLETPADGAFINGLETQLGAEFSRYEPHALPDNAHVATGQTHPGVGVVLEWSGRPLATARWSRSRTNTVAGPTAILECLVVDAGFRQAGFGRRLLAAIEDQMRAAGCCQLDLNAPLDSLPALTRMGFRPKALASLKWADGAACAAVSLTKSF
jgi:GNAT superfamily N-acetyltransferase